MKKNLLLLLCLVSFALTMNAQTAYENDFEDGFGEMTMVDNDGNTPAPNVGTYVDAWNLRETDKGQSAISNSWYQPAAAADDWLITPAIEIPEAGYSFIFEARAVDPNFDLVLPKDLNSGIQCSDYGPGCIGGVTGKVKGVEFIAVEFMNEDQAWSEARKINQYWVKNWVLDDVKGEPIIEEFVKKAFKAEESLPGVKLKID